MTRGIYPRTEEIRRKMSIAHKGKPSPNKGKQHSKEARRKISESHKKRGTIPPSQKGVKASEETRKKLRKACKRGKDHPLWKGGISKIDKLCRLMWEYRQWRSDIFARDNWSCQTCRVRGVYVTAHHIKGFSKIIRENKITNVSMARRCKELWDIDNGVTLCEDCHSLTDNYRQKEHKGKKI